MSDRLAEIEARLNGNANIPDPVRADLRDLLAAAKAARHVPIQHEAFCRVWLPPHAGCNCSVSELLAALANLGGATCPECNDTGMIRLGTDERGDNLACLRCDLEGGA